MEPTTEFGHGLRRYLDRNPAWRPEAAVTELALELLFALFAAAETHDVVAPRRLAPALA